MTPHKISKPIVVIAKDKLEADVALIDMRNRGIKVASTPIPARSIGIFPLTREDRKKAIAYQDYRVRRASFMESKPHIPKKPNPPKLGRQRVVRAGQPA